MKFTGIFFKVIILNILSTPGLNAQTDGDLNKQKMIGLKLSLLRNTMQDSRLSARSFTKFSPGFGIRHERQTSKHWHSLDIDFARLKNRSQQESLGLTSIVGSVQHSYRWKVGQLWIGSNTQHSTVLNFPSEKHTDFFRNSPISYTIAQSIGPSIGYQQTLGRTEQFGLRVTTDLDLWSYLIQPIQGHPYPSRFLQPDVFTPTRANMAGPLVKSGRLSGPKRFRNLRIQVGLFYQPTDHFRLDLGLVYEQSYANANHKAVRWHNQQLSLTGSYVY
ncbi:MAG: hypothetical protein AAGJ93_09420 [Bacteroidota bacterium]